MDKKKIFFISVHIIAWAGFIFLPFVIFDVPGENPFPGKRVFSIFLMVFFFYLNYFIFIPQLLAKRKFLKYSLVIAASLMLVFFSNIIYNRVFDRPSGNRMQYGMQQHFQNGNSRGQGRQWGKKQPRQMRMRSMRERYEKEALTSAVFIALLLSTSIKVTQEWYRNEKEKQVMEKEKLATELSFLKSQVNPHFLFNTLNGIYSLANQKSDKTGGAIVKLSELMRHMLYESEKEIVDLEKEIAYLENYIGLQKLRLSKDSNVSFSVEGGTIGKKIEPMLMIPFIENAFKHGVGTDGANIDVSIKVTNEELNLKVVNRISKSQRKDESSGIGLVNIKKQLENRYPDKHRLEIADNGETFSVDLRLLF
ncbi:MAG: hypothetical protein GXO89_14070 [Chlorobi bacterium]|nr:hypothetical protein [Chlorobiota bacterium]